MTPPTRWEIAFALFALATALYFLIDAGSWEGASRFVRTLTVASSGAVLVLGVKTTITFGKRRPNARD